MMHKSLCHCIYFMPSTLECVIYTRFLSKPPTVTAEVQASHPSVGSP